MAIGRHDGGTDVIAYFPPVEIMGVVSYDGEDVRTKATSPESEITGMLKRIRI
ncbi:MAG: hypothetical protein HY518_02650 [Candidatus Aenigmarchaeota archaeon]|nr:hypothetical protein [Candidatus Aenigmarchaeota archaeon]